MKQHVTDARARVNASVERFSSSCVSNAAAAEVGNRNQHVNHQ